MRPHPSTLALLMLSLAAPAAAETASLPCHDHREITRQLLTRYEETPVSAGLQGNGNLLQVFSSPRTGTWTVVSTMPSGIACIVAAGSGWQQHQQNTAAIDPAA